MTRSEQVEQAMALSKGYHLRRRDDLVQPWSDVSFSRCGVIVNWKQQDEYWRGLRVVRCPDCV